MCDRKRGGYNCYNTPSDGRMDGERVNSRGSLRSIFPFQAQSPSTETPFGSNLRCAAMTAAYVSAMIGMRNGAGVAAHPKAIRRNVRKATADFPRPAKMPRNRGQRKRRASADSGSHVTESGGVVTTARNAASETGELAVETRRSNRSPDGASDFVRGCVHTPQAEFAAVELPQPRFSLAGWDRGRRTTTFAS